MFVFPDRWRKFWGISVSRGGPAAGITTETASQLNIGSIPNRVLVSFLASDLSFNLESDLGSFLVRDWGSVEFKVCESVFEFAFKSVSRSASTKVPEEACDDPGDPAFKDGAQVVEPWDKDGGPGAESIDEAEDTEGIRVLSKV